MNFKDSMVVYEYMENWYYYVCKAFKGKMIIPVREPISRDISEYFKSIGHCLVATVETYQIYDLKQGFYQIYFDNLDNKKKYVWEGDDL